jgi:HEAT repeat protein
MSTAMLQGDDRSLTSLREMDDRSRCAAVLLMLRQEGGDARQTLLRIGAELVPVTDLAALLREEGDDIARNAGLEMLKLRGRRALRCAVTLLDDSDDDVVMQAVQLIDHIGDPRSWPDVRGLLRHENPNVVQAVIAAAPRIGGSSAAIDLLAFLEGDPWLQMTAIDALGRLRSRLAIPFLRKLLDDSILSDFAGEALARIGGITCVNILESYFVAHHERLDAERWLGVLAFALADLEQPHTNSELRDLLRRSLDTQHAHLAAACALALGPGPDDVTALRVLASRTPSDALPLCLMHRQDLLPLLLGGPSPLSDWGFSLARRAPERVSEELLERAIRELRPGELQAVADLLPLLTNVNTLIDLFLGTSAEGRAALHPALRKVAGKIPEAIASRDVDTDDRLLLLDIADVSPAMIADELCAIGASQRTLVLSELRSVVVAEQLPWREWIAADRNTYLPLFADIAVRCRSDRLLSLFRLLLSEEASPVLITAARAIADPELVPLLIAAYDCCSPLSRAFVLDALGEIGGPEARRFLRGPALAFPGSDDRLACRAFARCASAADLEKLEALTIHDDWSVRLATVEAFGRLGAINHPSLKFLVADPSAIVAQTASALLDLAGRDE